MNNLTINLSSNSSQYTKVLNYSQLIDHTLVNVSVDYIYDKIIPIYMKIDWGDGNSKIYDNDLSLTERSDTNIFRIGTLLNNSYSHEYYPSATSLYKTLTAQVYIEYCNGSFNWFMIPMEIRTMDYFESIYDIELVHTNILPSSNNPKEHQFLTTRGNYCIELRSS